MLNIGIIGFGKMGKIRAEAVHADGRGQVVGIFDADRESLSGSYSFVETVEELILSSNIDALFICTPNHLNSPLTIQALKSGKHVFCEKPPAFTSAEVEEIVRVEQESGKKLMYGFNHRHHESIQQIKSLVDSHEYGKLLWMRGRSGKSVDVLI